MKQIQYFFISALLCVGLSSCADQDKATTQASKLLVEGNNSPLNVHNPHARLSWHSNVSKQYAYQIQVASSRDALLADQADLWDSHKVIARQSLNIAYAGKPLSSGQQAFWRVRVWPSKDGSAQAWSELNTWEMGLLSKSDWQAKWLQVTNPEVAIIDEPVKDWMLYAANVHEEITETIPKLKYNTQLRVVEQLKLQPTASLFRRSFAIDPDKQVVRARLHSTAAGYYEIFINGSKVDDRLMDPGQTDFDKRILYNTDDVLALTQPGVNTLAVHLGSGWYDENIAFSRWTNPDSSAREKAKGNRSLSYGQPKFIAQLELTFADGSTQVVSSDQHWLSHTSPVLKEGLFSGELFDANLHQLGWDKQLSQSELSTWQPVEVLAQWPTLALEPQLLPPIRAKTAVAVQKIYTPKPNVWVLDFGQNLTGIPTLHFDKLQLGQNQSINLRYAEWADVDGNISQKSGGGAPLLKQVDTYVANGNEQGTWSPTFTWHGFRYVEVTGLDRAPSLDAITANLVRSDVQVVGHFESSNALVNRIHDMALWSYEGNLMAAPLDCPIRERAGWTGDAHAALITGNYNYNMQTFWDKYLGDFKTSEHIAPAVVPGKRSHGGKFDWAAAEILIAWEHYRHYGDIQLLASQYDSMLEYMTAGEAILDKGLIRNDKFSYGDWCDPVREPGMGRKRCNSEYTAPAITTSSLFAHSANIMAKVSSLLNKPEQTLHFTALFDRISSAFHSEFYDVQTNSYGSQTSNAMALQFDIVPKALRQSVASALNKDVLESWNGHGSVGAIGQTYLYRSLSDFGYGDTAYNIFTAEGYPGYQWQFDYLGATTLWERKGVWDPALDPKRRNPPGRSLNHPFHSGYDGWFYEGLGGIRLKDDTVGYQDFVLRPVFPADLDFANIRYTTGYGQIKSNWKRSGDNVIWNFTIPNNTLAEVVLPGQPPAEYTPGTYTLTLTE